MPMYGHPSPPPVTLPLLVAWFGSTPHSTRELSSNIHNLLSVEASALLNLEIIRVVTDEISQSESRKQYLGNVLQSNRTYKSVKILIIKINKYLLYQLSDIYSRKKHNIHMVSDTLSPSQ